eukprot:GILI01004920.1.p1 GENE.GILI01004920.1~~GILI01004920.1.p1  ORF type:complete len:578 (-),score=70.30 GILI01004920.1:42-1709(-)
MPSTLLAGRYEYQQTVGTGSFGIVRRYRDTLGPAQTVVAIKSISYAKIIQEGHRLVREIEIMLFLRDMHPHVINCFYIFATRDSHASQQIKSEIPIYSDDEQRVKVTENLKGWMEEIEVIRDRIMGAVRNKEHLRVDCSGQSSNSFSIHFVLPFMNGDVDRFVEQIRGGHFSQVGAGEDFWAITMAVIAFQLLFGMDFLHKSHIVHRDLKPENILLRIDTTNAYCTSALVADFGLACGESATGTFYVCTRTYRPPELIVARQTALASIDVWSLGCILYELVTWTRLIDIKSSRDSATGEWSGTQAAGQLERVMDITGTPSVEDINRYLTDDTDPVKSYLLKTTPRPSLVRQMIHERFRLPGCAHQIKEQWADLITACLQFFPEQRPTTEQLCQFPIFVSYGMVYGQNVNQYSTISYDAKATTTHKPEENVLTALGLLENHLSRELADTLASPGLAPLLSPTIGPNDPALILESKRVLSFPFLRNEDISNKYTAVPLQTLNEVFDACDECQADLEGVQRALENDPTNVHLTIRCEDLQKLNNYFNQLTNWVAIPED